MRALLLGSVLVLAACTSGPQEPACRGGVVPTPNAIIGLTGRASVVEFNIDTTPSCAPTAIEVGVVDGNGDEVEATGELDGLTGRVRFTPVTGGAYHVTARFQPNRGLGQQVVIVARDRSAEPGLFVATATLTDVEGTELNDAGFVITPSRGVLKARPDGGFSVQTFPGSPVLMPAGSVLWADGTRVTRMVPAGDVYVEEPDAGITFNATQGFATENDITLGNGSEIRHVTYTGGGFVTRVLPGVFGTNTVHRVGEHLFTIEYTRECVLDLGDGGTSCLLTPSQTFVGGDSTGFWVQTVSPRTLAFHGETLGDRLTLEVPNGSDFTARGGDTAAAPIVTVDDPPRGMLELVAAATRSGDLGLEYWGEYTMSATFSTIVTPADGGVLVRRR